MIDWVHDELLSWGEWAARCDDKKGDYPDHAAFAAPPIRSDYLRDSPFERVPEDFHAVDRAVKLLHPDRLKLTVMHLYKNGYRIRRTAAAMLMDPKSVRNYRDTAHVAIARMLTERLDKSARTSPISGGTVEAV